MVRGYCHSDDLDVSHQIRILKDTSSFCGKGPFHFYVFSMCIFFVDISRHNTYSKSIVTFKELFPFGPLQTVTSH